MEGLETAAHGTRGAARLAAAQVGRSAEQGEEGVWEEGPPGVRVGNGAVGGADTDELGEHRAAPGQT